MFEDPATTNTRWQDELRVANQVVFEPYVWHERADEKLWGLAEKTARGSSGWRDNSYQVNGYPYNLWMTRNADDPYYIYIDVAFSLRPLTPLPAPGSPPPWPS